MRGVLVYRHGRAACAVLTILGCSDSSEADSELSQAAVRPQEGGNC